MVVVSVVLAVALVMIGIEFLAPGRNWPRVSGWWVRALALNAGQLMVALSRWPSPHRGPPVGAER